MTLESPLPPEPQELPPSKSESLSRRMRAAGAVLLRLGEHWARIERLQALEACRGPRMM